jgi:hypothetical protein
VSLVAGSCLHYVTAEQPTAVPTAPSKTMTTSVPSTSPEPPDEKPQKGAPKLRRVPPAEPTEIEIPSLGIKTTVGSIAQTMLPSGPMLELPEATQADLDRTYWWRERAKPASPNPESVYIMGHTCHLAGCHAVFDRLQDIQLGSLIVVRTPHGVLTYEAIRTRQYRFDELPSHKSVWLNRPGRLVLFTCKLRANGAKQTHTFVVWSKLVEARQN